MFFKLRATTGLSSRFERTWSRRAMARDRTPSPCSHFAPKLLCEGLRGRANREPAQSEVIGLLSAQWRKDTLTGHPRSKALFVSRSRRSGRPFRTQEKVGSPDPGFRRLAGCSPPASRAVLGSSRPFRAQGGSRSRPKESFLLKASFRYAGRGGRPGIPATARRSLSSDSPLSPEGADLWIQPGVESKRAAGEASTQP